MSLKKVTVGRTGKPPLRFTGKLLAECDSEIMAGRQRNRWFEAMGYQMDDGNVVLAITYRSRWEGEPDFEWAERFSPENAEDAFDCFERDFLNHANPQCLDEWKMLATDLKQLLSEVWEGCGMVKDLDAVKKDSATENGG